MPSRVEVMEAAVAATTGQVFAAEKPNAKIIPTLMIVDNEGGDVPHEITLQDRFTPSSTNLVPAAEVVEQHPPRLTITVDNGSFAIVGPELANVEILGQMEVVIDAIDDGTIVTLAWEFK